MTVDEDFSFICDLCDRPALSFKPGTAPRVECGIMTDRGEPGERVCREHLFMQKGETQRVLIFDSKGE